MIPVVPDYLKEGRPETGLQTLATFTLSLTNIPGQLMVASIGGLMFHEHVWINIEIIARDQRYNTAFNHRTRLPAYFGQLFVSARRPNGLYIGKKP